MSATFPGQDRAKHMGELKRGDERWDVFVEMQPDAEVGAVRGRVHFERGASPHHQLDLPRAVGA